MANLSVFRVTNMYVIGMYVSVVEFFYTKIKERIFRQIEHIINYNGYG